MRHEEPPMPIKAVLLGSIGVLAETSELQREAFNRAFAEAGLDWVWSPEDYRTLLERPGGRDRIAREAERAEIQVDAAALHRRKSELFQERMMEVGLTLRPGVAEVIEAAGRQRTLLGLVTTTDRANVSRMLEALTHPVTAEDFAFIGSRDMVARGKPDPEIYARALHLLDLAPTDAVAVEDTPESAASALAAGIPTLAYPGHYHRGRAFPPGAQRIEVLSAAAVGLGGPA
ncbi:HAD family hydrolase [Rhodobacteraceae bacterium CCMM004]|nr:HAD family hydrolase [Rhodobacteraceae bacterium CCMM004]